jgi:hypothetical protein
MRGVFLSALVLGSLVLSSAPGPAAPSASQTPAPRIAWFGTWKEGVAEAKRSGRPILLIAAAPHCHNVSGMW